VIKAVFSASLLQTSVSHDHPSEIIIIWWLETQYTFCIINYVKQFMFLWYSTVKSNEFNS